MRIDRRLSLNPVTPSRAAIDVRRMGLHHAVADRTQADWRALAALLGVAAPLRHGQDGLECASGDLDMTGHRVPCPGVATRLCDLVGQQAALSTYSALQCICVGS